MAIKINKKNIEKNNDDVMDNLIQLTKSIQVLNNLLSQNLIGINGLIDEYDDIISELEYIFEDLDYKSQDILISYLQKIKSSLNQKYPYMPLIKRHFLDFKSAFNNVITIHIKRKERKNENYLG